MQPTRRCLNLKIERRSLRRLTYPFSFRGSEEVMMARMDFFEAQELAHRNTVKMVMLFALAVAGLIALANLLVLSGLAFMHTGNVPTTLDALLSPFQWDTFAAVAFFVCVAVFGGSLYKTRQLSGGGHVVAEALGGTPVPRGSTDPTHRKILNIVEEMAIASSLPVPPVYLIDESGINAFAAGWTPSDAIIGVTRGAVEYLSRDELQGVVAHEFSHILNGDMRLNIRLIGVLYGILLLGMAGYYLIRLGRFRRLSRDSGGRAVLAQLGIGLGLIFVGAIGTFFGSWIKAVVSRQREYLADASAVQFSRNDEGIAGALKKIGGLSRGSEMESPAARQFSHSYFAEGVSSLMESLFRTHPPLEKRILRLDPQWNGQFIQPRRLGAAGAPAPPSAAPHAVKPRPRAVVTDIGMPAALAIRAISRIGQPSEAHLGYAREILSNLPEKLKTETHEPFGVRAVIYALLLQSNAAVRQVQWNALEGQPDQAVCQKTRELAPFVENLDRRLRLPLIDFCMPALRELAPSQYKEFREIVLTLMHADKKIDLGEWVIQRVLIQRLDEVHGLRKRAPAKYSVLGDVKVECELMLSLVAYAEHGDDSDAAARAFDAGRKAIGAAALNMLPKKEMTVTRLDDAVDRLGQMKPFLKPRVLQACAAAIASDERVTVGGMELLRAIASSLDCPMPPVTETEE
jgi:Zn-dependent protease with chaperone function